MNPMRDFAGMSHQDRLKLFERAADQRFCDALEVQILDGKLEATKKAAGSAREARRDRNLASGQHVPVEGDQMTLQRSDYDQAARYLQHACDLMDSQAPGKLRATCEVLRLAIRRLSPGAFCWGRRG
jgi:hypothetical protein